MRPDGNCRACMVEIKGERVLAPSCCRYPTDGMEVTTDSARAVPAQKMVLELLLSDMPETRLHAATPSSTTGRRSCGVGKPRFAARAPAGGRSVAPGDGRNLDACIQCTRCVRACREEQVNDVIGYAFRGEHSKIVFDLDDPMGDSTCVACGECVQACPTGALMPARDVGLIVPSTSRSTRSARTAASAASSPTTSRTTRSSTSRAATARPTTSRLCVKGRYGFDYVAAPAAPDQAADPQAGRAEARATSPSIPDNWRDVFREASWDEALDARRRQGLRDIRDTHGKQALAGFGSAKGSNEEAYLFQKLVRTGFGTQQRRPLHAPVPRLERGGAAGRHRLGRGVEPGDATSTNAEVIFLIGANPTVEPPGGRDLDQERGQERRQADRRRPAPHRAGAPRARTTCSSSPTPTSRC